ncbi:hypothetical protein PR202_gb13769 [Eleusine coracana subsp. coracana]|uniref:Scarecrow-like protein 9 n=1 Tax=Eleusine coracana subsp. coracana TaxID=191504 RepID=A0AAV5ETX1_ELECO|nr:hypothetical protein PR202_gb13769 [Eleusine coracana subsp. coracana]
MGLGEPPEQQQDHTPLEYISRILMEEEDRALLQYNDDHPVLIQAQQSLAQIISSSSSSDNGTINNASTTRSCSDSSLVFSLDGIMMRSSGSSVVCNTDAKNATTRAAAVIEHNWSSLASTSFLTGMVEANKLLPKNHSSHGMSDTGADMSRASKLMAMTEPEEELHLQKMMDRMMLNDCEVSSQEMDDLRAAIKFEAAARRKTQQRRQVDLHALLIRCAEAAMDDHGGTRELLVQIKRHASPMGDATQRLAHCFAEALEMSSSSVIEFLEAYRLFMATCCFKKVAFAFSNRTIYRVAAGRSRLHIIDYGIRFGLQWLGLLRMLAAREGGPPEVTITGIDIPQPGFRAGSYIEKTGHQLSKCAREFGVPFRFHAVATANWDTVRVEDLLGIVSDPDAVLVVNSVFRLEMLADDSVVMDRESPRDVVLGNIRRMRPAVFTLGIVSGFYGSSFLTRFRGALYYFSAMFDVLDATMPRGSKQRLVLERDVLAPFALNVIACEGQDPTDRFDSYKQWQLRIQRAGLRQLPLDLEVVGAVREMVKKQQYHKDFVIDEDRQWLLQGWKGRILYAHSTWVAHDD